MTSLVTIWSSTAVKTNDTYDTFDVISLIVLVAAIWITSFLKSLDSHRGIPGLKRQEYLFIENIESFPTLVRKFP